jgi:hypothetical protein
MRLHVCKEIGVGQILQAASFASRASGHGAVIVSAVDEFGSRSHAHAWDVKLSGDGSAQRHKANGRRDDFAASYDSWGWFLSFLYEIDPTMKSAYKDGYDFHARTFDAYGMEYAQTSR